jgi:drug/metabolite transporter (DMT)-like permease
MQFTPRLKAYLMLTVVAIVWGFATPIIKFTLEGFTPTNFLAYRFFISTLLAIFIFIISGVHLPKKLNTLLLLLLNGFLNSSVALGLLFFGIKNTTILETGLITLTSPLLISTAGVLFLHEHVTRREKIGMAIAMIGTIFTIVEPLILNGHNSIRLSGNILVFGYVVSTLVTTIIGKKILKDGANPMTMVNISFIIGFLTFGLVALKSNTLLELVNTIISTDIKYHLGVLYMAIVSGTFAFYLNNKAQKTIEIGEQSLFSYLTPIFSLPLAVLWLGEKVTPTFIIGTIVIVIGVGIAEFKKKRYNSDSRN